MLKGYNVLSKRESEFRNKKSAKNSNGVYNTWVIVSISVAHFAFALYAFVCVIQGDDWKIPVVTTYANWKQNNTTLDGCGDNNCYVTVDFVSFDSFKIHLLVCVVCFHILSFSWPFLTLCFSQVRIFYVNELNSGRNVLRWLEYSLSAPFMIVVIAAVLGIVDVSVLLLLALLTFCLMWCGYMQEVWLTERKASFVTYLPHLLGWAIFIGIWTIVFFGFVVGITTSEQKPPSEILPYVYAIAFSMFALFGCFGIVQVYQIFQHKKTSSYVTIENIYLILSLTSKAVLGLLLTFMITTRSKMVTFEAEEAF